MAAAAVAIGQVHWLHLRFALVSPHLTLFLRPCLFYIRVSFLRFDATHFQIPGDEPMEEACRRYFANEAAVHNPISNSSIPSPSITDFATSKTCKIGGHGVVRRRPDENDCPAPLLSRPALGTGSAGTSLAAKPLSCPALSAGLAGAALATKPLSCPSLSEAAAGASLAAQPLGPSALVAGAAGASNKRGMNQIAVQQVARSVRHQPDENAVLSFSPEKLPKKPLLHLMDAKLDQICSEEDAAEITLAWTKQSGGLRDLTEIGINPSAYDASVLNALPFNSDDNLLLAVHTVLGVKKHLWFCKFLEKWSI